MQVVAVLALLYLVVAVSGRAIGDDDKHETTKTEAPTKFENILNPVEASRKNERRSSTQNYGKQITNQLRRLKKLCKPRPVSLRVNEVLGFNHHLLDFKLFPEVVGVKRCNTACSYCGGGLDSHGPHSKVCTSTATKYKTFTIQVNNDTSSYYEKLRVPVDLKCACRRPRHTAATTTVPSETV